MSLASFNRRHEITVQVYNETEPTREEGGLTRTTISEEIDLKILLMHEQSEEKRRVNGQRYVEDSFTFQVSSRELTEKSFEIIRGRTFVVYNGNTYRVATVKDYTAYPLTRAMQCKAMRVINNVD